MTKFYSPILFVVVSLLFPSRIHDLNFSDPEKINHINFEAPGSRYPIFMEDKSEMVEICNLSPGETYYLSVSSLTHSKKMTTEILYKPKGGIVEKGKYISFEAKDECTYIRIESTQKEHLVYLSVATRCQEHTGGGGHVPESVITTNTSITPVNMVTQVLIGGSCFDVSGVTSSGIATSRGTFANGSSSIQIETGIELATGNIALNTPGPNNNTGQSGGYSIAGYDVDLAAITGSTLYDVSKLEFNFKPTTDTVKFDYVFASEEYCDFVGSQFNDVFGFFISGPGITGTQNIANIPGTTTPVSSNNVNHINNSAWYTGNIPDSSTQLSDPDCTGHPTTSGPSVNDCQFDGFTKVLTAIAVVQPCQTYHIKLAIADGGDGLFDSAVFLKANNFGVSGNATVTSSPGTFYEGCSNGFFTFSRQAGDSTQDLAINFEIGGTATNGVDYSSIPTTVTIPGGQNSTILNINSIVDQLTEGTETITLSLAAPCSCSNTMVTLTILDQPPPLLVTLNDQELCGISATLTPSVSGGIPNYNYIWNTGSTTPSITITPANNQSPYTVTVSDNCGHSSVDTASVILHTPATAGITNNTGTTVLTCTTTSISVTATGGVTYAWSSGLGSSPNASITNAGTYTVTVTSANLCTASASIVVTSNAPPPSAGLTNFTGTTVLTCTTTTIHVAGTGGINYSWNGGLGLSADAYITSAGTYTVTVTGSNSCTATSSITITSSGVPPNVGINNNSGTTVLTCTITTINVTATGGTTYTWSDGLGLAPTASITNAGTYTVTVTSTNGCSATANITTTSDTAPPIAGITNNTGTTVLTCITTAINVTAVGGTAYDWSGGLGSSANASIMSPGTYSVTVTGANSCTSSAAIEITENSTCPIPTGLSVSGITLSSAILSWENAPCSMSILVGWYDQIGNTGGTEVTTSSALMSNLSPGTTYVVTAMSDCGASMSISSDPVTFTTLSIFYQDADGDGFGNPAVTTTASIPPAGYVTNHNDCNDNNSYIHPGATEICNSLDDNCNGQIDEAGAACFTPVNPVTLNIQATTADLNWLAVPCAVQYRVQFRLPGDASYTNGPVVNVPNISVTLSGLTASTTYQWRVRAICNNGSSTPNTSPIIFTTLPPPVPWYQDADGDGYGNPTVSITASLQPQGYVSDHTDCYDIPGIIGPTIHPGATEICDNLDNNCNGQIDEGVDGSACSLPTGLVTSEITYHSARVRWYRSECVGTYKVQYRIQGAPNYTNGPTVNFPDTTAVLEGLAESTNYQWRIRSICFNGSSSAFSLFVPFTTPSSTPTWYADTDSDGYGDPDSTTVAGTQPPGYVAGNTDCNDANVNIHPGATEYCNGIDDDCDGLTDESAIDCPTPTGQTVTTITATKARLNWLAANCATTYNVQYRVRGTSTWSSRNVNTLYLQLSNLLPGTQYEWRVRAKCGLYFSAFTTPLVRFTTLASLASAANDEIQTTDKTAQKSMPFERSPRFSISPNPSNGLFNVHTEDLANGTSHIKVMDQLGKTCFMQSVPVTKGEIQLQIDLTSLPSGLYYFQLMNGNEVWGEKVSVW